jgi:hypothetical protein
MSTELEIKQAIAELLKDRSQRDALAEMLVEFVQPNHITLDFVGMLLNTRSLKPGDSLVKKLRKGIDVRTLVPGSIPLASEITVTDRVNYILDGSVVKVTMNQWELDNGEIGTVDDIRKEMLAKLKDVHMNKVFTALSTIWNGNSTPLNWVTVGGAINATVLETAIDRINQTTGGVKAVVGTRAAMTPITKFGAFWNDHATSPTVSPVDSQLQEVMQKGMLGRYYGAPLVALDQIYDNPEDYNALLPTNKILVIGENVGEFITYGDVKSSQYDDPRVIPPQLFIQLYQQYGMIIDKAQGIYVIAGLS